MPGCSMHDPLCIMPCLPWGTCGMSCQGRNQYMRETVSKQPMVMETGSGEAAHVQLPEKDTCHTLLDNNASKLLTL